MADTPVPQPYGNGALIFLAIINLAAIGSIAEQMSTILNYKTSSPGSFTIGEAAYLGSLWSKSIAFGVLLLIFDLLMIGYAICNRLTALHKAILHSAGYRLPE